MNPEANFDVSVDYNILNDAIAAIKNIKSKCSQLISDLSSVDVSILDSAGEMAAAIATAESAMEGPVELVLGRIMEVETLFYMMQNQDFFADLQEAMQSGKFTDENGMLDIVAVMQHIVMNADGRYQDLLEDEDFRRMFVEQNILSVYGISSMEELENVRNGYLDLTRQYESERNAIVYDTSHLTKAFIGKLLENSYMFADFDTVAATTIMAYSYVDVNGMEIMVDSLDAVPTEKRNQAKQLSYADLCGDSELYGELKECLNGKASLAAIAFSSGLSDFEAKIDADIEASKVRLAELDNLINGEEGSRTSLMMIDGIVNDVNSRTEHLTNLYGYMINDDFEAMAQDLAAGDVAQAVADYKSGLFGAGYSVTNINVDDRSDEMNILYSLISGNGEFVAGNGTVSFQKPGQRFSFNSAGDDTLSNFAYWADQMTDDEKTCFYYVWNTEGQDAAYDYLQNMSGVLDTRWVLNQREIDSEFASDHKVAASVYSVLANPFEGFSALVYSLQQGINDDNMTRTQVYSRGDTMRQTVSSELTSKSELAGFAYNVGMSMADNMYSMILSGGNSTVSGLLLGVSSYNDSLNDALDRGLTDNQARLFAGASAGVEMLMEKISIDSLLSKKPVAALLDVDVSDVAKLTDTQKGLKKFFDTLNSVDKYTDNVFRDSILPKISGIGNSTLRNRTYDMANVIYNGVKQGIGEGNEELLTGIAGRVIDDWIADENSSYNISVQSYINQGYTESEAMAMANSEYRDELITSWLSGAASGSTMGGGQTIRGLVSNDIKINGMLSEYKTNPNYEAQLGELQSNMREGHYDAALTMVVDNGTSYEQGMSDANKLVDSLLNKGMIDEKGKTQLNAYLEADVKAHTVLEGTSYETGNNLIRNIIRQDIMDKNISEDAKYTRGLFLSSFDTGNSQRYDDASKIINNMEKNGIITSEQRDKMLVGVENTKTATDMVGHLQKGDAAATLAARKNPTVVNDGVKAASELTVTASTTVTSEQTQQSTAKADALVSDVAATAGALGSLGVVAGQTGLGAIATSGMDIRSDSDVDSGKPKVYSDERIVIEAETDKKHESLGTNKSASREVTQSELVKKSVDGAQDLKSGRSSGKRIGFQYFAQPKTNSGTVVDGISSDTVIDARHDVKNGEVNNSKVSMDLLQNISSTTSNYELSDLIRVLNREKLKKQLSDTSIKNIRMISDTSSVLSFIDKMISSNNVLTTEAISHIDASAVEQALSIEKFESWLKFDFHQDFLETLSFVEKANPNLASVLREAYDTIKNKVYSNFVELCADGNISDLDTDVIDKMILDGQFTEQLNLLSNEEFIALFNDFFKIKDFDIINTLLSSRDNVADLINSGNILYSSNLDSKFLDLFHKNINSKHDANLLSESDLDGRYNYGPNQGFTRNKSNFSIVSPLFTDANDFAEYLVSEKNMPYDVALELAKKLNTPGENCDLGAYVTCTKYLCFKGYSDSQILSMMNKCMPISFGQEYYRLFNKMIENGYNHREAKMILDCIDTTGVCSYAAIVNSIMEEYISKFGPEKFKQDFGFDLYVEENGKRRRNANELLFDMYMYVNSDLCGGSLFKFNNGKFEIISDKVLSGRSINTGFQQNVMSYKIEVALINKYLTAKGLDIRLDSDFRFINFDKSSVSEVREVFYNLLNSNKQVTLSMENGFFKYICSDGSIIEHDYYDEGHAVYVTGVNEDGIFVSTWGGRALIPFEHFINSEWSVSLCNLVDGTDNSLVSSTVIDTSQYGEYELKLGKNVDTKFFGGSKSATNDSLSSGDVSDIVAELEIYAAASKEGHGSIVKISSETKDNIAKLDAKQLLEVIKNTDVRYGMRTVMNSANSEQLSIVVTELISSSDTLISNPNFVRALSGNIDFNIYTGLVDSILSNSSGNNRLISTLSDEGIIELFNKYSENASMLKRLFDNMSASQYKVIYEEYFDGHFSENIFSDLLENFISEDLSNKRIGEILNGLYSSENLDIIDFANEQLNKLGYDKINEMVNDGTLIYSTELPPMIKKSVYKNINKSRDAMFRTLAGEYGVNQNAVGRNVSYYVTKPWVKDLNDFAKFLKEANGCSFAMAYAQAVLCNTPFVPLSAGNRVFITRYMAINSDSYSAESIMKMNRDILKGIVKSEYRHLLNRYIIKGVDMKVASMIFDSIDATGACSYAAFANLIVDSYKDNPAGFKKDFGFDLYEEVNGKKQFNSKELMADMFIFMNSIENGGKLFRYNDGNIRLINGSINPQEQVYVSSRGKFNSCAYDYLASKNPNLKLKNNGVIRADNMSKNELKNAIGKALQSGKQLDMYVGRNLLKPVNFHGPLGMIIESTLTWGEGGAHAVYVTGMTDNAVIVSSWGMRFTIPFSNLVKNPDVAFVVSKLENMSTVRETSADTYTTVLATDVNSEVLTTETVDVPVIAEASSSISFDTSNLDVKGVADLLVSVESDDNYDTNINQIFNSLSDDKFIDVVKYMKENSMIDCDMIGVLDSKVIINKLEILYDNSPDLILPFIETIPGKMGSVIESMFINSSNVNYGMIEKILNIYNNSDILTIVNNSPSLKNSLDMLPKIKEIYISELHSTLTSYKINGTRISVNLFTMDLINNFVNDNSSIDITTLLNDSTFSNDVLIILLDKLAKNGNIDTLNSIISSLDSGRLFEIVNQSIMNNYNLTSVIDSLSIEQFVSFVEQLNDDFVKVFLKQVSLEKVVSVYSDLGLSGRYKLDNKFGNLVDMLDLSIYVQKVNDGSMMDYVKQLSDSEFNEFIDEILRNEVSGVTDLIETIIGYDSDRISNMIENCTLEFNDKLPEFIKRSIMEVANARERVFESTADGTIDIRRGTTDYTSFGIDQDITRRHVKFTVKNNSWMKSLDHFVEFIISDAKRIGDNSDMSKEAALEFAKKLSTSGTEFNFRQYDIITRYLASNYVEKDVLKFTRNSFARENGAEYKRVLEKITPYCKDVVTATRVLDCINSTGVCSYAAVANIIFDYYKDIPDQFRKDFGFDLFVEVDGEKRINEIELLADMYITVNSDQMNGKLFRHGGFFGKGKLQTMSNLDTRFQVYMSNSSIGVDLDLFNKYLSLKNKDLVFRKNGIGYEGGTTGANNSAEIKKMFVDGLRSGAYIDLGISKTDKKIRFNYPDGSTYNSTFDWNEGGGHAVYVVGVTDDSVVVSSWGKKLLIPFEDLVDNKFRVSLLSKTDATTSPVTIPNFEVTQQNSDSVVNYTVSIDGSSYSVDSRLSFKDKVLEKYYDSVLKKISNKVNNSDLGYGTVSIMIEKSMGDYFKKLTSGSKIYEIMSSLNNKQMLFYAVNNCDLSLLSNEQLQGIINRAVKNGYVLNSYSSQFVKSNPNIIMRLLQPDSYYFRKNAGNSDSAILKNRQRQEAFIEFVNSINYSALNSEQISEIIDIVVKNGYYISEKSPSFIRENIEIISKVIGSLNEKYQYNQTLNSIDYSTLSDTNLLILADCVGKCRFGISEFIPSSLRSNFEFIMQVVNSSADGSINSKLSGVDYSNFSDQQLLDLMRVAVNKGYVLDVHSPIERLNIVLENDVKTYLETISYDYKELLIPIIDRLGYSSVGIEGYNGIFSQEMLSRFGVDFITDMYKYCNLTGSKVNFGLLISNGQIDTFKQIFDSVLGSKYNGTLSDIKLVKKIFDKCINNSKLFEDILSSDINDDVISNLRKYVNSNFRIEVNSVDELMQYDSLVKDYVDGVIASGDLIRIKDTISLLLFNASDGDMYDFNQTFDGSKKIDILAKKLGDSELSSVLKGYSVLLKFYQNKVASNNNSKTLISICEKLNNMSYDDRMSYLKVFEDIDGFVRYCYGVEVNESLTKLDSIVGSDGHNIRVAGKYTWQDGNQFVPVDYVEINSNYRLFQHTLNAFGEGGKLSDYQSGRVVGKSYLCLSMIGDNKIGVIRDTVDVDHVTLLFDNIVSQDLMACAPRDIGSSYRTENNQLFINNRGSRFDIVDNILSDTDAAEYNEYVIYRNNAKPAGILVTGVEANSAEIEAAAKLGVPLVKINYSGNEKISDSNNTEVSTEFTDSMTEFVGYLTGKNAYTVSKNSPSGQIIFKDVSNSQEISETLENGEYELQDDERLGPRVGIQYFAKSSEANSKFSLKRIFGKNSSSIDTKVSELREFIESFEDYSDRELSSEELEKYSDAAFEIISKLNKTDGKILKSLPIDVIEAAIRRGYVITASTPNEIIDNIMTNSSDGKLLSCAINYYDKLTDNPELIHKVLDSGYAISNRSPKFIRENYEYVSKFISSSDSASVSNFVNTLDSSVFTEEQLSNIITMAAKNGLVIDRFSTPGYIKNSPELIMNIVNNASSLELVSSVINNLNISTLSDSDMRQLVEKAKDLGYRLDINSPIVELNRGLNLLDDQQFKSFDSDYRASLEELITKTGYIHVYFEGYDGIFSKEVINLFGVDNVYQIYKYCNLVNIRLDFNELINRGELKAFKELYDTIYASNNIDSEFDILNFKRFISKYLGYDNIFKDIINRNLNESDISSIKNFVRSSFDIKISSYEELLNYNNLIKEHVLDVVNNGSVDDIKDVSSKLLFNQEYSQTVEFFRDVADSERLRSLAMELKDVDVEFSYILESYAVLFDAFNKFVINGSDIQRMKDFILTINNSTDSNILMMYEDITRNVKYYYGLELNKTLTKLDGFVKHNGIFSGTKYSIDGNVLDSKTAVDYIEVNSKYRLLQHKLNYGVSSGGKLTEYLNPRLIGNTYLCLSLIGDNKMGVSTSPSSINEVTLLFDEIIPRNLLLCSSTDLHSTEDVHNSLDVYAKDPYRFDLAEKILGGTSSGWWNEYTIYRENVKPSGILVSGDVPVQAEIDAAATLGVPLVKINYSDNSLGDTFGTIDSLSEQDGTTNNHEINEVLDDGEYELQEGESLGSRVGTQFFAEPKSISDVTGSNDSFNSLYEKLSLEKKIDILLNAINDMNGDISNWRGYNDEYVKRIINDNDVYVSLLTKWEFSNYSSLLNYFNSEIINRPENVKLLALNNVIKFGNLSKETVSNVQLMRECANQQGISPSILDYVSEDVRRDSEFISNLIKNCSNFDYLEYICKYYNIDLSDFYESSDKETILTNLDEKVVELSQFDDKLDDTKIESLLMNGYVVDEHTPLEIISYILNNVESSITFNYLIDALHYCNSDFVITDDIMEKLLPILESNPFNCNKEMPYKLIEYVIKNSSNLDLISILINKSNSQALLFSDSDLMKIAIDKGYLGKAIAKGDFDVINYALKTCRFSFDLVSLYEFINNIDFNLFDDVQREELIDLIVSSEFIVGPFSEFIINNPEVIMSLARKTTKVLMLSGIINEINFDVLSQEQQDELITLALNKGYYFSNFTPSFIKYNPEMIFLFANKTNSKEIISRIINSIDFSILNKMQVDELLELAIRKGYIVDALSPAFIKYNPDLLLSLSDDIINITSIINNIGEGKFNELKDTLISIAIKKGYCFNENTPYFIRYNSDMVAHFANNSLNLFVLSSIIDNVEINMLTEFHREELMNLIKVKGYYFSKKTPSFIKNDASVIMYFANNFSDSFILSSIIDNIDFNVLNELQQKELLRLAKENGYRLNINSNFSALNLLLEPLVDLSKFDSKYKDYLSSVVENIGCAPLYFTGYDGLFSYDMIDTFGVDSVVEIFKYITLNGIDADFKSLVSSGEISNFKTLYDSIFGIDVFVKDFDIFNFKKFCDKYLEHSELFSEVLKENLTLEDKTLLKRFVIEDFGVEVKSLNDLRNYDNLVKAKVSEIISMGNLESIKDICSRLLFNMSNEKMDEFIYIYGDSARISLLATRVGNPEFLVGVSVILDFFEKNILNNTDTERVRSIVDKLNTMKYEDRANISKMFSDVERVVKYYYGEELNGNLTKLNEITSLDTVNTREVGKYVGVKHSLDGSVSDVLVDYIKINSNYRFLQHTLNAYGSGGKITDFLRARLVGNSYICLSLVGNDKVGVQRDAITINSVSLLFDTIVSQDLLLCGSEDLASYTKSSNDLDVYSSRKERLKFDISDNILTNTSNEYHNEYTVYRDHIKPSGILVTGDVPVQAEIDAAATLGVPLVKINYKHTSKNSGLTENIAPTISNSVSEIQEFVDYLDNGTLYSTSEVHHDAVSVDSSRKSILGISKNSMLEMKLANANSRTIDSMIIDGKLNEYLSSLTSSEIYNGPLSKHVYQFANKMDLDAMGDSFVLLTRDQVEQVGDFMESIDDDLYQGLLLSQESADMMASMNSDTLIAVIDKLFSNDKYLETAQEVIKYIDDSVLGEVFDRVMLRSDSNVITSCLDPEQVVSLMNYYSEDSVSYEKFCRNVTYAKFIDVSQVLDNLISAGNRNAAILDRKLSKGIDVKLVSKIIARQNNGTLKTYLDSLSDGKVGQIFEKMIEQKIYDAVSICDLMIELIGQDRFSSLVRNGNIKFDTRFSSKTQRAILDIINQQRDGSLKELSVYGVDQGYIRSHIKYGVKTNWSDDISDLAQYLSKKHGFGMFEADDKAVDLTSQGYIMDYEEHKMVVDYLASKYGKSEAMRMASKIFDRKVDSGYVAALNKLVSHGTDKKTAQAILDCIDATGVCSYASVANVIVDAYKDNPSQFKEDFGFDLYTYENGYKEINSTELLADMYIYINSNLCGGKLFTITNGKVTTNGDVIDTKKQIFLSSNHGFKTGIVNKYLHSKNPNLTVNVTTASQFRADGVNSEVDNIKTAIVRAIQEGKQVTLGVYRTKGSEYKFLDERGVKKESTVDWSEGDGHAVYVTGVTNNGVVVSTWGKRRVIPFTDFINNEYSIHFIEIGIDGSVSANGQNKVSIYSNPLTAINDGRGSVMDGASHTIGLNDINLDNNSRNVENTTASGNKKIKLSKKQRAKIIRDSKKGYIKEQLKGTNKDEFYRDLGYEVKAKQIQFNAGNKSSDKVNINALKAAKKRITESDAIKLGKETINAQALEYAEKQVEEIIAGNVEYKVKGSPVKKLVIAVPGVLMLLSYFGGIGDIPLGNDISVDDILGTEEDELLEDEYFDDDSSDTSGGSPSNPNGTSPTDVTDDSYEDVPEIIDSNVMEPNEEVVSTIPQDVPVIESIIEEVIGSSNIDGQSNYVSNDYVEIPKVEAEKLPQDILDDEAINVEEPYFIPMSSNYVDITDKKDVSGKGIILGSMGLATLGALGTKLYLDKKKEAEEEIDNEEFDEEVEQEDNQEDIEFVDNNKKEEVDSDYEVPTFYSDTLKDEE